MGRIEAGMRRMLLVPATAALLLLPAGTAEDPAQPAAASLVLTGVGAGHMVLDVPTTAVVDDVAVLGAHAGDDVFGLRIIGPSAYFFMTDGRDHVPFLSGVHKLKPGTYHVYAFGPPGRPFALHVSLGDLAGSANYALGPAEGRVFHLAPAVAPDARPLGSALEMDTERAVFDTPGMVVLADHYALGGSGGSAVLGGLHAQTNPFRSDCIPRDGAHAISGGVVEAMSYATFLLQPGEWELGIDFAAVGSLTRLFYHTFGMSYVTAPGDASPASADAYWGAMFSNAGVSSLPLKVRQVARSAACTSLPHAALEGPAANP